MKNSSINMHYTKVKVSKVSVLKKSLSIKVDSEKLNINLTRQVCH